MPANFTAQPRRRGACFWVKAEPISSLRAFPFMMRGGRLKFNESIRLGRLSGDGRHLRGLGMVMFQRAGARQIISREFAHGVDDVARDRPVGEPLASCRLGPQPFRLQSCSLWAALPLIDNPVGGIKVRPRPAEARVMVVEARDLALEQRRRRLVVVMIGPVLPRCSADPKSRSAGMLVATFSNQHIRNGPDPLKAFA